jgi:hypothetical protein
VCGAAPRAGRRDADHTDHDRAHGKVLAAPGALVEHALAEEEQHEQADGHRRLHDHERYQQQGHDLQRPAEHRQARTREPARPTQQVECERGV